jgi:hypothetical protein
MSTENGRVSPRGDPEVGRSFDDLTRALANGSMSRRRALRLMSSALVGGVLASIPGVALAQNNSGGNSACAHFCNEVLPGETDLRGVCKSAAAHGEGLCPQCEADPTRICDLPSAPDQLRCCPEGDVCCGTEACCEPGETCCFGQPSTQGQNRCCPQGESCCGTSACCGVGQNCCPQENRCVTCRIDQVFNPTNCRCECPPGTEECGNQCRPLCPTEQTRDPNTCQCQQTGVICPRVQGGQCPPGQTCCEATAPTGVALCCPPTWTCCRGTGIHAVVAVCCPPGQCHQEPTFVPPGFPPSTLPVCRVT